MKTRTQNQPGTGGASSSSNAFKWLISLWPIVSAVRTGMRTMPSRWRGAGWGGSIHWQMKLQAMHKMQMKCAITQGCSTMRNVWTSCRSPPSPPFSFSPSLVRYMSEMSCGPCPCPLCPLSAMWHVRLLYKFRIYCQWQNMIRKLILLIK